MARLGKRILFCLILILSASNLLLVTSVNAQSISKPNAPKFSIQFPNNNTIQLVVANQEFTQSSSVNSIIYYYRVKDPYSPRSSIDKDYVLQSNSKTTIITIPPVPDGMLFSLMVNRTIPSDSTLIDFQVQAVTGYYAVSNVSGPPALISPAPQQWHTEITFNESEASDWSNPITVDLSKMAIVPLSVTPSPSVPEFPMSAVLCLLVFVSLVAAVFVLLSKKRNQA